MSAWSIIAISLAAGVVLVIGGSLMAYMSSLVKNAYQLKIELNAELDDRLRRMDEDIDKKSKWIKRDLLEEIDKIRTALALENNRKFTEFSEQTARKVAEIEENARRERTELIKTLENLRQTIALQDQKLKALRREQTRLAGSGATDPSAAPQPAAEPEPDPAAQQETAEAAPPAQVKPAPADPRGFQTIDLPSATPV